MTRPELPSVISARLREALQIDAYRRDGVDMSPAAVTERLRDAAEMSTLCLELVAVGARSR